MSFYTKCIMQHEAHSLRPIILSEGYSSNMNYEDLRVMSNLTNCEKI